MALPAYHPAVAEPRLSDADIDAVVESLTDPERFRDAEARVARLAPQLQRILAQALGEGGWFQVHEGEVLKAATKPDEEERLRAVRSLLAEETRMGMLVGVAVGWEISRELEGREAVPAVGGER